MLRSGARFALAAGLFLLMEPAGSPMLTPSRVCTAMAGVAGPILRSANLATLPRTIELAQDDDDSNDIPTESIAKYVAVYRDMQRDRSLTIEQATAREGMSLGDFRKLEGQIERDDAAMEQVRDELQAAAKESAPNSSPSSAR
jgi:hypothetical protein